jgi:GMP synthase (glutamine-hydrolysing)
MATASPRCRRLQGASAKARARPSIIADEASSYYAMQFHPEVVHTPDGAKLIRNFVHNIAGFKGDWTMRAYREEAIEKIRAQVGKGKVICALSGGVDSARGRRADPRGDRRPAHLRVRRSRPDAQGRGRRSSTLFRDHYNIPLVM